MPLGNEHVRPMQADDQRDRSGRGSADHAPWKHPVRMQDSRVLLLCDAKRLEPTHDQRKRRNGNGRPFQPDIGPHSLGVTERVQCPHRSVMKKMKMDASIDRRPCPFGMPWRHYVHFMSARSDTLGDWLHEAAD
jgi:hypothetical protein